MTIDAKCIVCRNPDRRRLIELGWNGGMSAEAIGRTLDLKMSGHAITKHLKEHADGRAATRQVDVEPELPARQRVLNLQRLQLDEVERRIGIAKSKADLLNAEHENDPDWVQVDWSEFYDILSKEAQAAVTSILRTQGLTDKREAKTSELKLGLFEAMASAGLAPKALVGEAPKLLLEDGDDDEAD